MVGAAVRTDGLLRSSRGNEVRGYRQAPHIGTSLMWSVPAIEPALLDKEAETRIISILVHN